MMNPWDTLRVRVITTLPTPECPHEAFATRVMYETTPPRTMQRWREASGAILVAVDELGIQELMVTWSDAPRLDDLRAFADCRTSKLLIATANGEISDIDETFTLGDEEVASYRRASRDVVERLFQLSGFDDDD